MARRTRLNIGFLGKIAVVLVLVAGCLAMVWKYRKPHNPAPYIQAADEAMKASQWDVAAANLDAACGLLPQREDLHLKLGRCYFNMVRAGMDRWHEADGEFNRAAELNPNDPDAWIGLLDVNEYMVAAHENHAKDTQTREGLSKTLGEMRDAARRLAVLKPDSIQAQSEPDILTLRSWILNITLPETDEQRRSSADKRKNNEQLALESMSRLTKLMTEHPESEKIPYWLARAKIFQGQERIRTGHADEARPFFVEASNQFDASLAARPDVVGLYLEKAQILANVSPLDNQPNNDYGKRYHETLSKVQGLVDPVKAPDDYERAKLMWAENLGMTDVTGAEDVYHKLMDTFPDHLYIRLQLAKLLQRNNRQPDALVVLDAIPKLQGPPVTELTRRQKWDEWSDTALLIRADIQIDQFEATRPGDAKDKLAKDIMASLDKARRRFDGTAAFLSVLGRFQLYNGQKRDAIDTLTAAQDKMGAEGGSVDASSKLLETEALAYAEGGQTNRAVELLHKAMMDPAFANSIQMHLYLAKMQLQNQDYMGAGQTTDWLAARLPRNPEVIQLKIKVLGPDAPWEKIKPLFDDLPEKTPGEAAMKANVAMVLKNSDEAARLLAIVNKDNPGDIHTAVNLATYYQMAGKLAEARSVIQACIDKNPNDPTLPPMLAQLTEGTSKEEVAKLTVEGISKITDPFSREMALSTYYQRKERPEDELEHLLKAEAIQPNNVQLLGTLFSIYVGTNHFSEAQAMIPHMADLDCDQCHGVMLRCKLALAMNDIPSAVQYGRQMIHDEPNFGDTWEMYGEALQASGDLAVACEQYQSALLLQATNTKAMTNLIACNVARGKLDTARSDLERVCKLYPNNPTFREMRQRFTILYGDPQSILQELNDQIQEHPDEMVGYVMDIDALKACVRSEAGRGNADAADLFQKQAQDRYQQATQKWPDDLRIAAGFADLYMQANDVPHAEKVLKALADRPHWKNEPKPLILLGQIYLSAHQYALAEQTLRAARRLQPNSVEALLKLAECMQYQGRASDALAVLDPGLSNFAIRAKYTELQLGMPDGAKQADFEVSEAMKAQPGNRGLTNLMLEVCYAEALQGIPGKREQGIKLADDSLNADHSNVYACLWRAKLLTASANPDMDAAATDLTHFLDAVPGSAEAHMMYARILDAKRDRDGAIRELQSAIKLAPQEKSVRLYLIGDLLNATPPQTAEVDRLLQSTLALPQYAHDPDFETQQALLLAVKGDQNDKALKMIQQAVRDSATNPGDKSQAGAVPPSSVPPSMVPDYFKVLMATKNYDLLLSESDKYVDKPGTPWFVFSDRGVAKASQGDIDGATAEFSTALDKAGAEPASGAAMTVVGLINTTPKLGPDKASEMIRPRAQNSPLWQLVLADHLNQMHDFSGARKQAELALGGIDHLTAQDQFGLMKMAADLYLGASPPDMAKAAEYYRKLLAIQPNDISTLNNLACILVDHDPTQALVYSQKAYDLCMKSGGVFQHRIADTQGWVMIQTGKVPEGIQILHNAEDVQYGASDFPDVHYHLGMGYLLKHDPSAALSDLTKARDLLDQAKAAHQPADEALSAKVDAAIIQAKQGVEARSAGKPAA
jgi:tetratricopeptide (TPR) repeat protein